MKKFKALSLIELIVTMSILLVLISISFGRLSKMQINNRRHDAYSSLVKLKATMEQAAISGNFMQQSVSSVLDVALILYNNGSPKVIASPNQYYNISVVAVNQNDYSYTIVADAQGQQAEKEDPACIQIKLIVQANKDDRKLPEVCW